MMGKTHIAVGIAVAYLITQPKTATEFVAATVGGSIGGIMADIDVKIDRSNKIAQKASMDALYGEILAIAISVCALTGDYFSGGRIIQTIIDHWQTALIGAVMFIALTVIGEVSKHRDRTHSLLALVLFSTSTFFISFPIGLTFSIGYASHLLIDLLNKSPIRILYPLKKGICIKVCYADRLVNELLLIGGVSIITLYCLLYSFL